MASGFRVRRAERGDLAGVLAVQHEAFGRVARMLGIDPAHLPPLLESLDDLRVLFEQGTRFWVAETARDLIVGSVRSTETAGVVEIGRLVVDGAHLRQGVASALMDALEADYPAAARFTLFTGAEADVPLALYQGRGYRECRREDVGHVELVWLEKRGPAGQREDDGASPELT